ncbi:MAG: ABC transporter ATP-binding protein/permease [Clostridiales bacterium]|jgi:ABC-type multidrug transport system fused ATPase/permease subunit|nr:ABC transporter ATP-binding protein/permease [Clostridiales bacterium]
MKLLWKMGKDAAKYKFMYIASVLATLMATAINLTTPSLLSGMTSIVENGLTAEALPDIHRIAMILLGLYLLRIAFRFASNYFAHKAAWHLVGDLRKKVYGKIQSLSLSYFHDKQTGDLMSRVMNDTATFELLYAHIIPEMMVNVVTVVGVMAVILTINVRLALLTCIPVPFIFGAGILFAKKIRPKFREAQKAIGALNSKLQDNFAGIHEIQSFNQEEREAENIASGVKIHTDAILYALKLGAVFHPSVEFLSSAGTVIVVGVGGYIALSGNMSVSDIVAFLLYLSLFYGPVAGLARILEDTQQAYAGAERVAQVLDAPQEIYNAENAQELTDVKGEVEFQNVSFSYEENVPVLKNISVKCEAGKMLALVGPTGVGKTTFTQLIPRFYDPTGGKVLIDGKDIRHVTLESLRGAIAPVLQDTYLFNGTVAENIAYAKPDAPEEEIIAAAKAAWIHNDITEMPDGYQTQIGERGIRLSGGQKQRVAIARAILMKAPIIILDEATASVDTQTEREIQRAINELSKTKTIIAIAHRLSTIQRADMILVLKDGEVVQRGTHEDLYNKEGLYGSLHRAQS